MNTKKSALRISVYIIILNIFLTVLKLAAGIFGHSGAMISDAVNSASDVLNTFIVIIGLRLAGKDSDSEHQYGHERLECIAAIILSVLLAITGLGIGASALKSLLSKDTLTPPGTIALIGAALSAIIKELMYRYTKAAAKRLSSPALMASAWDSRSDTLSSAGIFAGILGSRLGLTFLDPLASIIICILIIKAAVEIFTDSANKMTDRACDSETIDKIRTLTLEADGVLGIDDLKTRLFGSKIYIDIEICADGNMPLSEAHSVAERVHDRIEQEVPHVKHCMVHVNPR